MEKILRFMRIFVAKAEGKSNLIFLHKFLQIFSLANQGSASFFQVPITASDLWRRCSLANLWAQNCGSELVTHTDLWASYFPTYLSMAHCCCLLYFVAIVVWKSNEQQKWTCKCSHVVWLYTLVTASEGSQCIVLYYVYVKQYPNEHWAATTVAQFIWNSDCITGSELC